MVISDLGFRAPWSFFTDNSGSFFRSDLGTQEPKIALLASTCHVFGYFENSHEALLVLQGYVNSKVVPGHSSGGEGKGPVVTWAVANAVGMCLLPDPLTTVIVLLAPWSSAASSVLLA